MKRSTRDQPDAKAKPVEKKVKITTTETVRLEVPGEERIGGGWGTYFYPTVRATMDDLRDFVGAVEGQFGFRTNVKLHFSDKGVTASETTEVAA